MKLKVMIVVLLVFAGVETRYGQNTRSNTIVSPRIALIESSAFAHPETGIKRLVLANNSLEAEFKPVRDEIVLLQKRFDYLNQVILKGPLSEAERKVRLRNIEEATALTSLIERKNLILQSRYSQRVKHVTEPIIAEIAKALHAFAKQRNIDIVLDASKLGDAMIVENASMNITKSFIDAYNARIPNPPTVIR